MAVTTVVVVVVVSVAVVLAVRVGSVRNVVRFGSTPSRSVWVGCLPRLMCCMLPIWCCGIQVSDEVTDAARERLCTVLDNRTRFLVKLVRKSGDFSLAPRSLSCSPQSVSGHPIFTVRCTPLI